MSAPEIDVDDDATAVERPRRRLARPSQVAADFGFTYATNGLIGLIFFVTSADSGALVLANLSSKGLSSGDDAPIWLRLFWAAATGLITLGLLFSGGFSALQSVSVAAGLLPSGWLLWLAWGAGGFTRLAGSASIALALLLLPLALLLPALWALLDSLRGMRGNLHGLCSGMPNPDHDAAPALTPRLHQIYNGLLGRDPDQPPVCFGDLWGAAGDGPPPPGRKRQIDLQVVTSALNLRRPLQLPGALDMRNLRPDVHERCNGMTRAPHGIRLEPFTQLIKKHNRDALRKFTERNGAHGGNRHEEILIEDLAMADVHQSPPKDIPADKRIAAQQQHRRQPSIGQQSGAEQQRGH